MSIFFRPISLVGLGYCCTTPPAGLHMLTLADTPTCFYAITGTLRCLFDSDSFYLLPMYHTNFTRATKNVNAKNAPQLSPRGAQCSQRTFSDRSNPCREGWSILQFHGRLLRSMHIHGRSLLPACQRRTNPLGCCPAIPS